MCDYQWGLVCVVGDRGPRTESTGGVVGGGAGGGHGLHCVFECIECGHTSRSWAIFKHHCTAEAGVRDCSCGWCGTAVHHPSFMVGRNLIIGGVVEAGFFAHALGCAPWVTSGAVAPTGLYFCNHDSLEQLSPGWKADHAPAAQQQDAQLCPAGVMCPAVKASCKPVSIGFCQPMVLRVQ